MGLRSWYVIVGGEEGVGGAGCYDKRVGVVGMVGMDGGVDGKERWNTI